MTVPENWAVLVRMAQAWHQLAQANEQTEQRVALSRCPHPYGPRARGSRRVLAQGRA